MAEALYFKRLNFQKEQKLLEAITLFNNWLDELLISGISQLQNDPTKLDEIASRMVDWGAPGIARKLRIIPERIEKRDNWMEFAMQQLGEFYLVVRSFKRLEALSEAEKEDLLSFCGIPFTKAGFSEIAFYTDDWCFLGTVLEKEEKLLIKRNWFFGLNCKSCVLFLEFQFNRFAPTKQFKSGVIYKSAVQFYPSTTPQRIKDIQTENISIGSDLILKTQTVESALDSYSERLSVNPLLKQLCFILSEIKLVKHLDVWYLAGKSGQMIRITNTIPEIQQLLAYSSNDQNIFICEYDHNLLRVFSVVMDHQLIRLSENS